MEVKGLLEKLHIKINKNKAKIFNTICTILFKLFGIYNVIVCLAIVLADYQLSKGDQAICSFILGLIFLLMEGNVKGKDNV